MGFDEGAPGPPGSGARRPETPRRRHPFRRSVSKENHRAQGCPARPRRRPCRGRRTPHDRRTHRRGHPPRRHLHLRVGPVALPRRRRGPPAAADGSRVLRRRRGDRRRRPNLEVGQFVVGSFFASDGTCEICLSGYQTGCVHRQPAPPPARRPSTPASPSPTAPWSPPPASPTPTWSPPCWPPRTCSAPGGSGGGRRSRPGKTAPSWGTVRWACARSSPPASSAPNASSCSAGTPTAGPGP